MSFESSTVVRYNEIRREKARGRCHRGSRSLFVGDPMREEKREDKRKEQVPV
jgi:hypothetical protein